MKSKQLWAAIDDLCDSIESPSWLAKVVLDDLRSLRSATQQLCRMVLEEGTLESQMLATQIMAQYHMGQEAERANP